MSQLPLDYQPPVGPRYHYGPGYSAAEDQPRWSRHCAAVLAVLERGGWWTYEALGNAAGVPVGSVRTRCSNLKAGGVAIETRMRADRFREVRLG